jgi:hypothetical protein
MKFCQRWRFGWARRRAEIDGCVSLNGSVSIARASTRHSQGDGGIMGCNGDASSPMNHVPLTQMEAAFDDLAHQAANLRLLDTLPSFQILHHRLCVRGAKSQDVWVEAVTISAQRVVGTPGHRTARAECRRPHRLQSTSGTGQCARGAACGGCGSPSSAVQTEQIQRFGRWFFACEMTNSPSVSPSISSGTTSTQSFQQRPLHSPHL